jgi:hypothetical protein
MIKPLKKLDEASFYLRLINIWLPRDEKFKYRLAVNKENRLVIIKEPPHGNKRILYGFSPRIAWDIILQSSPTPPFSTAIIKKLYSCSRKELEKYVLMENLS